MEETSNKELLDRVRSLLQRDKIRLWEAPYTDPVTGAENLPNDLVTSICAELGNSSDEVRSILSYLRRHALEKLATKQRADWIQLNIRSSASAPAESRNSPIQVSLPPSSTGQDLEKLIQERLNLHDQHLKMICSGRMVQLNQTLSNQNVRSNATILVIAVPQTTVASASDDVQRSNLIQAVKDAARILDENAHTGSRSNQYRLRLTNQYGQELTAIPDEERRSLIVAMSLHEKGRSFLRQRDYLSALALFSEADHEFRQCSSQILNSVDNWGLLNLDIVWCYLNMRNVNDLQDANERLMKCDTCFVKVYGNAFERLKALQKDGTGHIVLFVRLHLLQAIVAYHAGRKTDAKNLLNLAEEEAQMMRVDPAKLTEIMLMGYTAYEARRGLRSAQGNLDQAIEFIIENRRMQEQVRLEEEAKEEEDRLQRRYGRTQNGEKLNISHLKQLQSMGYPRRACAEALKQTNNRLEDASDMLIANLDTLMAAMEEERPAPVDTSVHVPELVALGADPDVAQALLTIHNGQLERAAEEFLQKVQTLQSATTADNNPMNEILAQAEQVLRRNEERETKRVRREEEKEKQKAALESIVPDLLRTTTNALDENADDGAGAESNDYLDLLLDEEETFMREYRQRLIDDGFW